MKLDHNFFSVNQHTCTKRSKIFACFFPPFGVTDFWRERKKIVDSTQSKIGWKVVYADHIFFVEFRAQNFMETNIPGSSFVPLIELLQNSISTRPSKSVDASSKKSAAVFSPIEMYTAHVE